MAEVRQAAKYNNPLAGLAAYDKARHAGKPSGSCFCCAVHDSANVPAHAQQRATCTSCGGQTPHAWCCGGSFGILHGCRSQNADPNEIGMTESNIQTWLLTNVVVIAGIQLNTSTMDILLYLCSGGRKWDSQLASASAAGEVEAGSPAAAGDGSTVAGRGSAGADARGGSSNGSAAPAPSKDAETAHASASPQDTKPGEAGDVNGRDSATGRDGTQQHNAAASLSEEVRPRLLQKPGHKLL